MNPIRKITVFAVLTLLVLGVSTALVLPALASDGGPVTSLVVTKTAQGHWDRYLEWTLEKTADPDSVDIFVGDEQEIKYTVTVSQIGYTDKYRVSGQIKIENDCNGTEDKTAYIEYVDDAIEYRVGGDWIEFHRERIRSEFTIPSCDTEYVDYDFEFTPPAGATEFRNVAHVGLTNHAPPPGVFKDFLYRVNFNLPNSPTLHNECVDVSDSYAGYLGQVCGQDASQTFTYYRTVSYDAPGTYYVENTATADGQEVKKKVTVKVWALDVSKEAYTSFNRYYAWTIDKWATDPNDPTNQFLTDLTLSPGQQFLVEYWVKVNASFEDKDFKVWGDIDVDNPAPIPATINGVEDWMDGMMLDVDCGVTFPYQLPAGETLSCSFSADLDSAFNGTNTAKATLQNYAYDYMGNATSTGTTYFEGTDNVAFGDTPADEFDECITISDSYAGGPQGVSVCYDQLPWTHSYSRWIGPYDACGNYTVENTASFVTNDTGATGSDPWTVVINVPGQGCTLTQGYWKTHSKYGPAPYDSTWDLRGGGDALFLGTGESYHDILWMVPKGGNAYLILAHQYIAAELNQLNGAYVPAEVQDAMDQAEALLIKYQDDLEIPKRGSDRALAVELYELLDDYNNGLIGPGHCSE